MVALPQMINADEIPERDDFSPLPAGTYAGIITASEMKPTKDGTGTMLVLTIDVVDGEYQGRKIFERLNLRNKNPQAEEIAEKTLGEITRACGKTIIKDSDELHNKRFMMVVEVEQGKPYQKDGMTVEGKPQNRVKKYHAVGGAATATGNPQAAATAAGGASSAAPWKR
jgi:hypothetical protein